MTLLKGEKLEAGNKFSRTSLRMLWNNARWALALGWDTDKKLLLGLVTIAVLLSVVPAALAITVRELVDVITAILRDAETGNRLVFLWLGAGLAITLVDVVGAFAENYFSQRFRDELNLRINNDILQHANRLDVAQFEDPTFQNMLERIQNNIASRFSQFVDKLLKVLNHGLQMTWLVFILVDIEPLVFVVLVGVALPYLFLQWRLAKQRYTQEFYRTTKKRWTRYFTERLTKQEWVPESKLLNLGPLFVDKFNKLMAEFRDQNKKIYGRMFLGSSFIAGISSIAFFLTFIRVALRVLQGGLSLGNLAIYGGATARLRGSLEQAILAFTGALEQTLHISNLRQFLQIEPQIIQNGNLVPEKGYGRIDVQNLTFAYPGADKPILKNISFTLEPGETLAIVGRNGAGKTTLVKLLARLYEPDEGCIRYDNCDMRELARDFLRRQIAFVFQRYGRYEATAADNIAYGDWERLLGDQDAIREIAQLAGVDDLVRDMPQGYDTMLGRMFGDYTLSGGQWQKLAIARAFARDASLIILDEPTSNLDAINEFRLYNRFQELAAGRTTILISHRFSTVSMANRIIVLDKGEIIESGTHEELLFQNGLYAKMYGIQRRKMYGPNEHV